MPGNLQTIPTSVIESWPAPNYDDPVRRNWLPVYAGFLQAATTLLLGTRLWLRSRKEAGALGLDDLMLIPAFLAGTMYTTLIIIGVQNFEMDRHIWDVRPSAFVGIAFVGWLAEIAFVVSTCATKVSVLLFYRRLTQGTYSKTWRYATIGAIAFTVAYCVALLLVLAFNCTPTDAYWLSYSPSYKEDFHCVDTPFLNPLSGALSVISDFYSVALPVCAFWKLEITKRRRWALNAVFGIGLLVVIAGIIRTYYLARLGTHYDITWLGFDVYVWAELEIHLAIICASAPSLRVLFRQYLSDPISRVVNSARSTGNGSKDRESKQTGDVRSARADSWKRLAEDEENTLVSGKRASVTESVHEVEEVIIHLDGESVKTLEDGHGGFALQDLQRPRLTHTYKGWRSSMSAGWIS